MRLVDADNIVKIAEHAYYEWNLAMAAADSAREINKVFKKQELYKAVKNIVERAETVDAAPVVRCKDCDWYHISGISAGCCKRDGFQWPEDGFCSMGEIRVNMEV